ncbi:MAG: bacillithiol biosynthesis cysteine-adding enzyme BshC [Thermoanaerobaculia bacterium]
MSAPARTPPRNAIDLLSRGAIRGLPAAWLEGRDLDLLAPLEFWVPGTVPERAPPPVDRTAVARGLEVANASYGHPRADELAAKLARPATRVVIGGQQVGLFGGPLLALVKAAAAVRHAEALEAAGVPAVALFWMATEDHDWDEIATATFPLGDELLELALGEDGAPLVPVGLRTVGPEIGPVFEELAARFPSPWFTAWRERLGGWWRPDSRFGEAFARQLVATLGGRSPLLVDSMLPELKRAQEPHLRRLIERRTEVEAAFQQAERATEERGYELQVAAQRDTSPLFLLRDGLRRRIEWIDDGHFRLRGSDAGAEPEPVARLLETIADNPAVVSPGVLARPAIQDAVFGTTLQIMGPAETAYLAQARAVYPLLELAAPTTALRPQALVVEARQRQQLDELGSSVAELLYEPEQLARRLAERAGGGFVAAERGAVEELAERLRSPALALDANLEKPWQKTRDSLLANLDAFAAKVEAAAARRDEVAHQRRRQLETALRPAGKPQERLLSAGYFPGRFGDGFGAALLDQLELDPRLLSVVDPSPGA